MIDTLETLFGASPDAAILRAEFRRLFGWLKERGVTAVITGERGDGSLTRYGIEEYVSDCVVVLDHRVDEQTSTRRLRILKYRGLAARHQRVPVPDRRARHRRSSRSPRSGSTYDASDRARLHRHRAPRRDAAPAVSTGAPR